MKKIFFVLTALNFSSQLFSQSDSSTKLLDEVVVTANKYPNKTSLTGKVITIITQQQLERSGGKDLSQILNEQSGLSINGANSNMGKDKSIYLRGARVEHTLITIDGVPVYDPSGIGGNFDIRNIAVQSIERIEILKGSQSTLYGSDALAGVINIITKKGNRQPFAGNTSFSYGTHNSLNGTLNINGEKKNINYALGYAHRSTSGINDAISNIATADKDSYSQNSFQASLGVKLNEKTTLQPFVRFSKSKGDIDQGAFIDELDYTFNQQNYQVGVRNKLLLGSVPVNLLYQFNNIQRQFLDDSTKSRNGYDTYSKGTYAGSEHFLELNTNFPLSKQVKLTAGMDYRNSNADQQYYSLGSWGPFQSHYAKDSLQQQQLSFYGAFDLHTAKYFSLEVGSRLNIHSEYGAHSVFSVNPSFLFKQRIKLFANFSSAYRTPSLFQLYSEYGNKQLKPESALTIEGGVQYFSSNNKWNGRIVAYNRNVSDIVFFYSNPITWVSQYINQDKQKDFGADLELSAALNNHITLKAFYNYVDGRLTTKLPNQSDTTYKNLLRRPQNSWGINIESRLSDQFYISSNVQVVGKRNDIYFDATTFSNVHVVLSNYLLWNIFMEYKWKNSGVKFFMNLKNITNSHYTEVSGFNTLGRQAVGGLCWNF